MGFQLFVAFGGAGCTDQWRRRTEAVSIEINLYHGFSLSAAELVYGRNLIGTPQYKKGALIPSHVENPVMGSTCILYPTQPPQEEPVHEPP